MLPQLTGDQRIYRNYQTQLYFGDTWKMTPNLTLSYGLNYQMFSVPYETRGLESTETLTFNQYFGARAKQSAPALSGPTAVPIISYILGGKANNGPPIYQPQYNNFAPRFAFAYNPGFDKKTVFNGGAGLVYDRTIINAIQQIQDQDSYLFQQSDVHAFGHSGRSIQFHQDRPASRQEQRHLAQLPSSRLQRRSHRTLPFVNPAVALPAVGSVRSSNWVGVQCNYRSCPQDAVLNHL